MNASTRRTLREWFEAALEVADAQRSTWVERECTDASLRLRLQELLLAHARQGPLDGSAAAAIEDFQDAATPHDAGLIGSSIGGFRLLSLLGQGGMATVFLGQREGADFEQHVALKLLRRGLYSDAEQRLFRRERRLLARLSHANIARLVDGGVTAAGIPYLVMEYVDGVPVTEHAEQHALDLRARLQLFLAICRAVEAAHRSLIVHRDLKPSNILVDRSGAPKLLDFGIAKLLDDDEDQTQTGAVALTPGYAAPEQFAGGPITTATDVYALGVLLHELLLGRRPEPGMPRLPSSRASTTTGVAQRPGVTPREIRVALRGDLDNVLLKALAAEAPDRYPSAGALADDVERYLQRRPVLAHPPSRWYRVRKFVQRHRGGVTITTALVACVFASLGLALLQATRASQQADLARAEARKARDALSVARASQDFLVGLFENAKGEMPQGQLPTTRELLDRGLEQVESATSTAPEVTQVLLGQFVDIYRALGELDRADAVSARQLAQARTHFGPGSREFALASAEAARIARARAQDAQAEQALRAALDILRQSAPDTTDQANVAADLGAVFTSTKRFDLAVPLYAEAGGIFAAHCAAGESAACRDAIAIGLAEAVNFGMRGDPGKARERLLELLPRAQSSLGKDHLLTAQVHMALSGVAAATGEPPLALSEAREALRIAQALGAAGLAVSSDARNLLALDGARRGDWQESATQLEQLSRDLALRWPDGHRDLALVRSNLADQYIELGRFDSAREQIVLARAWYQGEAPPNRFDLARLSEQEARMLLASGAADRALPLINSALDLRRQTPDQRTSALFDALLLAARINARLGVQARVQVLANEATETSSRLKSIGVRRSAELAHIWQAAGDPSRAQHWAQTAWKGISAGGPALVVERCRASLLTSGLSKEADPHRDCDPVVAKLPVAAPLARELAARDTAHQEPGR